jgi:hypothetical protein
VSSTYWTNHWYSFTDPAIRHNAPPAPGILAIALARGEWLLVKASLNLREELLELITARAFAQAGDVVFSTEFPAKGPFDERVAQLKQIAAPRWGSGEEIEQPAATSRDL